MHGRKDDITDFVEFRLREVNYIDLWSPTQHSGKIPAYHTPHGSYLALNTLRDISIGYSCYGFTAFDKSTVVNLHRIREIVPEERGSRVIFKDGSYVRVNKKFEN